MRSSETLATAAALIGGDRNETHGNIADNMQKIANLWNAYLGTQTIEAKDAAIMMALVKAARIRTGQPTDDHFIDFVGYGAIAGEVR
jgi:hypothetical protein